jgi:Na+/proline symporter
MFVYYQRHQETAALMRGPDDALSVFVVHVLPAGMRGLMVVAILSAVVDSVASGMAASTAVVQVDFIRRLKREPLSDRSAVLLARTLIFLWGVLIILAGLWVRHLGKNNSVIQVLNIVMYPFTGVLLGVFLLGILSTRATAGGALSGAIIGFLVTVAVPLSNRVAQLLSNAGWGEWAGLAHLAHLSRVSSFYFGACGALATVVFGYLCSLPATVPERSKIDGLTKRFPAPSPSAGLPQNI